jgi:hypothetical protein
MFIFQVKIPRNKFRPESLKSMKQKRRCSELLEGQRKRYQTRIKSQPILPEDQVLILTSPESSDSTTSSSSNYFMSYLKEIGVRRSRSPHYGIQRQPEYSFPHFVCLQSSGL